MSTDEPQNNDEVTLELPGKEKSNDEKIDQSIYINKWGFAFIFLFGGLLAYIITSYIAPLPPFTTDILQTETTLANVELFTALLIIDLVLLMIGLYFMWFWKGGKKKVEITDSLEEQSTEVVFTTQEEDTEEKINNIED
ncbi:MAG: hypothetical protein ACFFDW_06675 [Candidatus Thorarchaeota archaeon]